MLITQEEGEAPVTVRRKSAGWRGRIFGCQSLNHSECYGELWQCACCGKTICFAEGTDDEPTLCDDCWLKKHDPVLWQEVERRRAMQATPKLQRVVTQLLKQYGGDVNVADVFLWLVLPAHSEQLIIERIDEHYLSVALAWAEQLGYFALDPQLFFCTDTTGWTPIHADSSEPIADLTQFAEAWAQRILDEGWLEQSIQLPDPVWVVDAETLWASMYEDKGLIVIPPAQVEEEELCDDLLF